tara:strand:- start:791 stop:1285 length:495 start_codon:yes stop_codon:yes gene_type:complete
MNAVSKRKGLAKVLRKVEHKELLVVEVTFDPSNECTGAESLCFINKTKQSWMIQSLEEGDEIGIELPLKAGRGPDPVTWALQNHDQPESLRQLNPLTNETDSVLPGLQAVESNEIKFSFASAKFTGEEAEWLNRFCGNKNKGDAFEDLFKAALPMLKLLQQKKI